jgi:DNA (cytosine-5)-methyltransferase 1
LRLRHLDLFSGIGGFSLGLESAGLVDTVAFCDFDKYCKLVLKKHWEHVPIYNDVKELNYERLRADGIISDDKGIDIITGGYPCQPFSVAGRKKGEEDPRHVWPEMFRLVQELRPSWVIGENVGGHIKLGLDTVLENLASEGYTARTFSISASSIGANHQRERIWTIAHPHELGRNDRVNNRKGRSVSNDEERNIEEGQSKWSGWFDRFGEISSVMEDTRRSHWPWSEFQGENGDEIGEGNADQFERSSSTSQSNVADSDTRLSNGENEEIRSRGQTSDVSSARRGEENVADSKSISSDERELRHGRKESEKKGKVSVEVGGVNSNREVADSDSERLQRLRKNTPMEGESSEKELTEGSLQEEHGAEVADSDSQRGRSRETNWEDAEDAWESPRCPIAGWWDIEPNVGRVAHGVPKRVDRLKSLGNSVVPQIPFLIGLAIRRTIDSE